MFRRIIIAVLLIASLCFALYTYWPMLSPYLPAMQRAKPAIPAPAATSRPETAARMATKEAEEFEIIVPTVEVKLVDPFAVRVEVKTRAEEPLPSPKPMEAEEKPAVKPVEPALEGIWVDSEMKVAFISGQALPVGGTVLGWKVISISKENVVLQKGSMTKTLKLEGR